MLILSIAKYIVNLEDIQINIDQDTDINVAFPETTHDLIQEYFNKMLALLSDIQNNSLSSDYSELTQKVFGFQQYVPALELDFQTLHTFEYDVLLTGITYSQTGWKTFDKWSFLVDGEILFEDLFTKELGEYKHFNVFYPVKAGQEIKFVHHNSSGNSKQIWWDIHYLMDNKPLVPKESETPLIDPEISRLYDYRIEILWGSLSMDSVVDSFWLIKTGERQGENVVFWNMSNTGYEVEGYRWSYGTDEENGVFMDIDNGYANEGDFRYREVATIVGHPHGVDRFYFALNEFFNSNLSGQPILVRLTNQKGEVLDEIDPAIIPFANNQRSSFGQILSENTLFPVRPIYEFIYDFNTNRYNWLNVY